MEGLNYWEKNWRKQMVFDIAQNIDIKLNLTWLLSNLDKMIYTYIAIRWKLFIVIG